MTKSSCSDVRHWSDLAACRDHPELDPDAWFDMKKGHIQPNGIKALFVCQTRCPVMIECRESLTRRRARDQLGGGGWFDTRGKFHEIATIEPMDRWRSRKRQEAA